MELESTEPGVLDRVTWRSLAAGLVLFGLGVLFGATLLGDLGETPCYKVEDQAQPVRDRLAATFGGGEEGRQAVRDLAELAEDNPGCFHPDEVRLLRTQLQRQTQGGESGPATVVPTASPGSSEDRRQG